MYYGGKKLKPNYNNLGFSQCMGKELREVVEGQLLNDLKIYGVDINNLKFDWSECCVEGYRIEYLDGEVENFSYIMLFNEYAELAVEGWMEFIYEEKCDLFIVYWNFLNIYQDGQAIVKKEHPGIPKHIYEILPQSIKEEYKDVRFDNFS